MTRPLTLVQYVPGFVGGVEPNTATVATVADLDRLPWVQYWRSNPEGFYRFSQSTVGAEVLLMAETAYGLKAYVVGRLDGSMPDLPIWRRREPRQAWTSVVPGDLPTRRLVVRSTAIDFRKTAEIFTPGPGLFREPRRHDAERFYTDEPGAKAIAAGQNYYGPYVSMRIEARQVAFQALGDDEYHMSAIRESTVFLAYLIESLNRTFEWEAYSIYEDSGESSAVLRDDGPELAQRLALPPLVVEEKTVILGPEHDARLRHVVENVLVRSGTTTRSQDWHLGGSQELGVVELTIGGARLVLEAETYVGLSLRGPSHLIDRIAAMVREEMGQVHVLERGRYNVIVGHLDAPLPGLPLWRARPWWTLIVPGDLPTKVLNLRSSEANFRRSAETFDLRPLGRKDPASWDSVVRGEEYGYVMILAREHEVDFRAVVNDDTYAPELDRSTRFLRHLVDCHWRSLTWKAYSWDEDSGKTTRSICGDGRQLAQKLLF